MALTLPITRCPMRLRFLSVLILSTCRLLAQSTATIDLQRAILSSQQGIAAADELKKKWEPALQTLQSREAALTGKREALERDSKRRHGIWPFRHAMRAKEKARRTQAIDAEAIAVRRQREDARAAFENDRKQLFDALSSRMSAVAQTYAIEHAYQLVGQGTRSSADLTDEVIKIYDSRYPASR